jgi:pimeloyl-ACP methyl ester carboxylesterase
MTTTTGYVNSNGMRLWYEGRGQPEGAPVVLVMGVDASSIWWPRALVERLVQAGLRVVRFDNRDIGLSTHLPPDGPPYGLADMASDTRGLLDALGIRRAHLVGMSLGGMIGQWLAIHDGDRVGSLTLISTTPGPDPRLPPPTAEVMAFVSRPPDPDRAPVDQVVDFCRVLAGRRFPFDEE